MLVHSCPCCHADLANGPAPKKQKKTKKDDVLPSLDAMLGDGAASNSTDQPAGTDFTHSASGPQEAALHLLESLLQVCTGPGPICSFAPARVIHACYVLDLNVHV